ncbi:MAG: M16 family metallopeptidase, partial [Polyangiaceae bacterium]
MWLLERHTVPLVSCRLVVPSGAASDPPGKAGLAYLTANMLDEGAGSRGAIELSRALDDLGAHLETDASADASSVSLTVLASRLAEAFALFADMVARPRLEAKELARVRAIWANELAERAKDPDATSRVVFRAALFGPLHPYGHPWDGTPRSARAITLDDVRRFHRDEWRLDRATIACAGDVSRERLTSLLDQGFGAWKPPPAPASAPVKAPPAVGPWPRLVLVDRPDAPQSVVAVVRPGLEVTSPDYPAMWRVNEAIGGDFASRLNEDLREQRGLTYGASSLYSTSRGPGLVVAWADVETGKTGEALRAMLADLHQFAAGGLSEDEIARSRSQARAALVGAYES